MNEDLNDKSEHSTCPWSHAKEMLLKIRQEIISRNVALSLDSLPHNEFNIKIGNKIEIWETIGFSDLDTCPFQQ